MAKASDWVMDDIGVAVDVLNSHASDFDGIQFSGWHSGFGGLPKVFVEDVSGGPTAYGVISLGQSVKSPSLNNGEEEPWRESSYLVQVFTSSSSPHVSREIYREALIALARNSPLSHDVHTQLWESPTFVESPSTNDNRSEYYASVSTVPYFALSND